MQLISWTSFNLKLAIVNYWLDCIIYPSAIGVLVVLLLICTRVDSPLCQICAEKTAKEKVLVPIVDKEPDGAETNSDDLPMGAMDNAGYEYWHHINDTVLQCLGL